MKTSTKTPKASPVSGSKKSVSKEFKTELFELFKDVQDFQDVWEFEHPKKQRANAIEEIKKEGFKKLIAYQDGPFGGVYVKYHEGMAKNQPKPSKAFLTEFNEHIPNVSMMKIETSSRVISFGYGAPGKLMGKIGETQRKKYYLYFIYDEMLF